VRGKWWGFSPEATANLTAGPTDYLSQISFFLTFFRTRESETSDSKSDSLHLLTLFCSERARRALANTLPTTLSLLRASSQTQDSCIYNDTLHSCGRDAVQPASVHPRCYEMNLADDECFYYLKKIVEYPHWRVYLHKSIWIQGLGLFTSSPFLFCERKPLLKPKTKKQLAQTCTCSPAYIYTCTSYAVLYICLLSLQYIWICSRLSRCLVPTPGLTSEYHICSGCVYAYTRTVTQHIHINPL